MKSKKRQILASLFSLCCFFYSVNSSFAKTYTPSGGLDETMKKGFGGSPPITSLPEAIGKFVGAILAFVGVLFLILMIYGGFIWMTARGNEQEVEKAKDLITEAIIGLVIVLAAYAITVYVSSIIFV